MASLPHGRDGGWSRVLVALPDEPASKGVRLLQGLRSGVAGNAKRASAEGRGSLGVEPGDAAGEAHKPLGRFLKRRQG
jgi:hypothetical protein